MKNPYYLDKYKYCPLCSKELSEKSEFIECSGCGYRIFDNSKPAITAIIENNHASVLLVKRKLEPFKGWLDFPGGFIQSGENLEKAISREIKEELGVEFTYGKYIENYAAEYVYQDMIYRLIVFVVSGKIGSSEVKVGDDVSDYLYMHESKVKSSKMSFPEVNLEGFKKYMSMKNNHE